MARGYGTGTYGRVGGRRSGGGAWQWLIIGGILGMGCSAIFVFGLLTLGVLNIEGTSPDDPVVALQNTSLPQPTANLQATVDTILNATLAALPTQAPLSSPTEAQPAAPQVVAPPSATPLPTQTPIPTEAPLSQQQSAEQSTQPQAQQQPAPQTQGDTGAADPEQTTEGSDLLQPAERPAEDPNALPAELVGVPSTVVDIPGGTFAMGTTPVEVSIAVRECTERDGANCIAAFGEDSVPAHQVSVSDFQMEITEVTVAQYVAFLNFMGPGSHANQCFNQLCVEISTEEATTNQILFDSLNYEPALPIFENQPIVNVTWFGARAYCEAIGRRLPTEAQWERAARGETSLTEPELTRYPWGQTWDVSFARTNRPDPLNVGVVDIRSYDQNVSPYGVFDMAGNAAEWVFDYYGADYYTQQLNAGVVLDPSGPVSGTDRVIRGGGWDTPPFFSRSVHRQHQRPNETYLWLGFRCAQEIDESAVAGEEQVNPSDLGPLTEGLVGDDALEPTQPSIDAAPTLPAFASPVPNAVPPGG